MNNPASGLCVWVATSYTMSQLISRTLFKLFAVLLGVILSVAGYFSYVGYHQAIESAGKIEYNKLESISHTFAAGLESRGGVARDPSRKVEPEKEFRRKLKRIETLLLDINRYNGLKTGLCVVLFNENGSEAKWIGVDLLNKSAKYEALTSAHTEREFSGLLKEYAGLTNDTYVFYSYPIAMPDETKGYIVGSEDISNAVATASAGFYKQVFVCFLVVCFIGFVGFRMLRRVMREEVFSKNKLKALSDLADKRNEELETLMMVLRKSENLILLTDQNGKIEWLNEVYQKKNNYSEDELESFVGKELAEVSHYAEIEKVIEEVKHTRKKLVYEAKSYDSEQNEFWASTTITPILDKSGEVEKLLFIDTDITRLKRAEKEVEQLANFTRESTWPVLRIHSDFTIMYSNEPGSTLLKHWNARVGQKMQKKPVMLAIQRAILKNAEQNLNIAVENRLYKLALIPVAERGYVNIYGEDITELQQAEKASQARALEIEEHNLNITDSINYARRIQEAILPDEDHIRQYFKNSFAFSQPKDIVSGDFFWIYELKASTEYILALADCTGHGVPGAMMSIVGHGLLNEIVEHTQDPAEMLSRLNCEIIRSLRQKSRENTSDGMDVSIIRINVKTLEVTFSGAYQHIYWMNGSLNLLKGDRQPIGGLHHDTKRKFTNHTFRVSKGDALYLMSDGYADQFGGKDNKKFMSRRLAELIQSNHKYSMQAQSFIFKKTFEQWKGSNEQIDDVSLIGIKI